MATTVDTPGSSVIRPKPKGLWVGIPKKGDPRIPFAVILFAYAVIGDLWLGFNRSPVQIALTLIVGCGLDMLLHYLLRERKLLVPLSAFISSLSIALILNYEHDMFLLVFPIFITIASKYLITFKGNHAYNPSLFGVVVTLLFAGTLISAAPAYQWGGTWALAPFMTMAALSLFIFRVGKGWLVGSFLVFYTLQTALRAMFLRYHVPAEVLFVGTLSTPPFFLFTFYMITDPKTSPKTPKGQVFMALAITLLDLYYHTFQSLFTFFYAAGTLASGRFLFNHINEMRKTGVRKHLNSAMTPTLAKNAAVIGAIALAGGFVYTQIIRPHVVLKDVGFALKTVPSSYSNVSVTMDPQTLKRVDKRVLNVSKWMLSVGASANVADFDNDGLQDLFLVSPLATAHDKTVLFRNTGDFKFVRLDIPILEEIGENQKRDGLASGALWFDSDDDGDQDLLVLKTFDSPLFLRNELKETGAATFIDDTQKAGFEHRIVSVSATAFDYDRDGHQDVFIGNILEPYLKDYDPPRPFNIFDLPKAEYKGDRRALHFMHNSWHNATSGGKNLLLHNQGDGTFKKVDVAKLGMPETHYTLSIGASDLNNDGWTDLYLASDFGHDDVYINRKGKRFERIEGRFFGTLGKDTYKGMNSSIADFDRNNKPDVYVSNDHHALQAEGSLMWMNYTEGKGKRPKMTDEAARRGTVNQDRFAWGAGAGDLDNDGWVDFIQANGMVDDRLDNLHKGCPDYWYVNQKMMQSSPGTFTYADKWGDLRGRCIFPNERRRVYYNRGDGENPQFVDVSKVVGLNERENSRGVAMADFDNDGLLDSVITNQFASPTILRNVGDEAKRNAWITVQLQGDGKTCPVDAPGSVAWLHGPGKAVQRWDAQPVNGFSSQAERRIHFGLGKLSKASQAKGVKLEVLWCGTKREAYQLQANTTYSITRGTLAKPIA